jgi:hypothetical protein
MLSCYEWPYIQGEREHDLHPHLDSLTDFLQDSSEATPTKLTPSTRASRLQAHISTPSEADLTDMVHSFITPSPSPAKPRHDIGLPPFPAAYQNSPLAQAQTLSPGKASSDPGASPLVNGHVNGNGARAADMLRSGSEMSELDLATASFGSPAAAPSIVFGHSRDRSSSPAPSVPEIAILDATIDLSALSDDDSDIGVSNGTDSVSVNVPRLLVPEILRLRLEASRDRTRPDSSLSSGSGADTPTAAEVQTPRSNSPFPGSTNGSPFAYPTFPSHKGESPVKKARSSSSVGLVFCRACGKDPCEAPTATMCGHVFCKG